MPPSNGPSSRARVKRQTDGDSITVPGWPEREKSKKPSQYYLPVTWGLRRPCWRGCSSWKVISRVPEISPSSLRDRKSTRLNSSHSQISYAVFCLKKKKQTTIMSTNRKQPNNACLYLPCRERSLSQRRSRSQSRPYTCVSRLYY